MLATSNQPPTGSSPSGMIVFNGKVIFEADLNATGEEPFAVALPAPVNSGGGATPVTPVVPAPPITPEPPVTPITPPVSPAIPAAAGPTVRLLSASKSVIDLNFSDDVSASFGRGSFSLIDVDTGQRIDPAGIRVTYNQKTNTAQIIFRNHNGNVLLTGHYRLRIAASKVHDGSGTAMAAGASYGITIRKKND